MIFKQLLIVCCLLLKLPECGAQTCVPLDVSSVQQFKEDEGLRKQCEFMNGQYTRRGPLGDLEMQGDKCTMTFKAPTKNAREAKEFCELYAPWRLLKAEHGVQTTCTVEATLMCKPGWIQMFGHCYKLLEYRVNYVEAESWCESMDAQLPSFQHRYIVGVWKRYFPKARQFWVIAPEWYDNFLQLRTGPKAALALKSQHADFAVPANSVIKVPGDTELQVLCEYKPRITMAELRYSMDRYGEIYHQPMRVDNGFLIRSTEYRRNYPASPDTFYDCLGLARAFGMMKPTTFNPYHQERLNSLDSNKLGVFFTNSGLRASYFEHDRLVGSKDDGGRCVGPGNMHELNTVPGWNNWTHHKFRPATNCNNMRSVAFQHFPGRNTVLQAMPDSRDAPIVCEVGARPYQLPYLIKENVCPYARGGRWIAHHRLWKKGLTHREAVDYCATFGYYLTGFDDWWEMNDLQDMFEDKTQPLRAWVGGIKREECKGLKLSDYTTDVDGPCYKGKSFEWMGGVARQFPALNIWLTRKSDGFEYPDFTDPDANCLQMVYNHPDFKTGFLDIRLINVKCDNEGDKADSICGRRLEFMPRP